MRFKTIITTLVVIFTTSAFANLPPTTVKGLSETSPVTTFNFQVPYNQASTSAGSTRYLDSGNRNLLLNSSFEASTATTSWNATTATGASESTVVTDGKKSYKLSFSASTGNVAQSVTPTIQMSGINMEASCKVKTTLTTAQICALNAGSEVQCQNVSGNAGWVSSSVYFSGPASGSVGVDVKTSASTTGDIYVDDCYVGPARNIGTGSVVSQWVAYTPTISAGFGTVTGVNFKSRRNGANLEIFGTFQSGTTTAAAATVSIGYNGIDQNVTADLNVIPAASSGQLTQVGFFTQSSQVDTNTTLIEGGTSLLKFGSNQSSLGSTPVNANGVLANNKLGWINAIIPITGWANQPQTISVDQANTEWATYVPTIVGWGTISSTNMWWRRQGDSLEIQGRVTIGTPTAVPLQFGLPSGLTISSSKVPNLQKFGTFIFSAATTDPSWTAMGLGGNAYLGWSVQDTGNAGLTLLNAAAFGLGAGTIVNIEAKGIPIQGWVSNQNAPLLVGSVTSNSAGAIKLESALVSVTGAVTEVGASDWISGNASLSTSVYTITLNSGFSTLPVCQATIAGSTSGTALVNVTSSTSLTVSTFALTALAADRAFYLTCMGAR